MNASRSRSLVALLLPLMWLVSCVKPTPVDEEGLILSTENYLTRQKTLVQGFDVHWADGDEVNLNGKSYIVSLQDGVARVVGYEGTGTIYGRYPADLVANYNAGSASVMTFPTQFTSRIEDGRQIIALPMVALGDASDGTLTFRHLSAAVRVRVRNGMAFSIVLDSVVVSCTAQPLAGNSHFYFQDDDLTISGSDGNMYHSVQVSFTDEEVAMSQGEIMDVQVPILPIAAGDINLMVYTHRVLSTAPGGQVGYRFAHTAAVDALPRNTMATAQVEISMKNGRVANTSAFSVAADRRVMFAKGNLYYLISSGEWRFQEQQYTVVETASVAANYEGAAAVGLFGWGTNGKPIEGRITEPTATSTDDTYGPAASALDETTDWGANPIVNAGNTANMWRSLTYEEWAYILNKREVNTEYQASDGLRFCRAKVGNTPGVVLFPDVYVHPAGVDNIPKESINVGKLANAINIPIASWILMEKAGAVFLPITGIRKGTVLESVATDGRYYAATYYKEQAYGLTISAQQTSTTRASKSWGCAVRLVQDIDNNE